MSAVPFHVIGLDFIPQYFKYANSNYSSSIEQQVQGTCKAIADFPNTFGTCPTKATISGHFYTMETEQSRSHMDSFGMRAPMHMTATCSWHQQNQESAQTVF